MSAFHKGLTVQEWAKLSVPQQFANIGSEVLRAISWQERGNETYTRQAFYRALDLTDLALSLSGPLPRLREVARMREALVDYFSGQNAYASTKTSWETYFGGFMILAASGGK